MPEFALTWPELIQYLHGLAPGQVLTVIDGGAWSHHRVRLEPLLEGFAKRLILPGGEQAKQLETLQRVWQFLYESCADRQTVLLIIGGGATLDLGAFAASTWMRGVRFVLVPTTLLALIDASVGGKTGIDFLGGKNLLGTFAHPVGGLIDPEFLTTLSPVDRLAGLAEMLKHGLIADANHWHTLKKVVYKLLENPGSERFTALYNHSITLKRRIVAQDPTEQGLRKLLNFGHTVGHAAESALLSSDAPWSHGIAVGFGLYVETALSVRHAGLAASEAADICQFLQHLGYPAALPTGAVEAFFDFLQRDKKNIRNETRFVLLQSAGRAVYDIPIPVEAIREALGTVD